MSNSEAERKAEKKADADEQKAAEQPGNGADNSTGNDNPTNDPVAAAPKPDTTEPKPEPIDDPEPMADPEPAPMATPPAETLPEVCAGCLEARCAQQAQACTANDGCARLVACATTCAAQGQLCVLGCLATNPMAAQAFTGIFECASGSCADACPAGMLPMTIPMAAP